jgi:hypothetical protein
MFHTSVVGLVNELEWGGTGKEVAGGVMESLEKKQIKDLSGFKSAIFQILHRHSIHLTFTWTLKHTRYTKHYEI